VRDKQTLKNYGLTQACEHLGVFGVFLIMFFKLLYIGLCEFNSGGWFYLFSGICVHSQFLFLSPQRHPCG